MGENLCYWSTEEKFMFAINKRLNFVIVRKPFTRLNVKERACYTVRDTFHAWQINVEHRLWHIVSGSRFQSRGFLDPIHKALTFRTLQRPLNCIEQWLCCRLVRAFGSGRHDKSKVLIVSRCAAVACGTTRDRHQRRARFRKKVFRRHMITSGCGCAAIYACCCHPIILAGSIR